MNALTGHLMALFDLSWLALADDGLVGFAEVHGDVPSVQWVAAFAEGSRSGADPANDTTGSGVFVEPVPDTGFTVCGGRPAPIRRRERHEIALLVMVASRFIDALGGCHGRAGAAPADCTPADDRTGTPSVPGMLRIGFVGRASSPGRTVSASRR